jgi:hypothetical protein
MVLGSETGKVLTHSNIPVLVVRPPNSRPVRQPIAKAFVPPCRRGGLLANDSYAVVALASSHFAMLVAASP